MDTAPHWHGRTLLQNVQRTHREGHEPSMPFLICLDIQLMCTLLCMAATEVASRVPELMGTQYLSPAGMKGTSSDSRKAPMTREEGFMLTSLLGI